HCSRRRPYLARRPCPHPGTLPPGDAWAVPPSPCASSFPIRCRTAAADLHEIRRARLQGLPCRRVRHIRPPACGVPTSFVLFILAEQHSQIVIAHGRHFPRRGNDILFYRKRRQVVLILAAVRPLALAQGQYSAKRLL